MTQTSTPAALTSREWNTLYNEAHAAALAAYGNQGTATVRLAFDRARTSAALTNGSPVALGKGAALADLLHSRGAL